MNVISYTAFRQHLAKTMDDVCSSHRPVAVSRSGHEPAVLISLEDYESLVETAYLLENSQNREVLKKGLRELAHGEAAVREVDL